MIHVTYRGQLVAAATAERAYVSAPLLERGSGDAQLRFVLAMCMYAMDVDAGVLPGPYGEDAAAAFARARLMPRREFVAWLDQADDRLAWRFGVPLDEVAYRRRDLAGRGASSFGTGTR
jgi:hypothetical protein